MNTENTTYVMPEFRYEQAMRAIEIANHRAERSGIPYRFTWTEERWTEEKHLHNRWLEEVSVFVPMVKLVLNLPTISHDGWRFVATLQWDEEAGLLVRTVPGESVDRTNLDACRCDVCRQARDRNDTYIVRHEDGRELQVGSSCIQRFLGLVPPGLWMLQFDPTARWGEEEEEHFSHRNFRFGTDNVLQFAAAIAQREGYVSRAQENESRTATSTLVLSAMDPDWRIKDWADGIKELAESVAIVELAKVIREAVKHLDGNSEYAQNMRSLMMADTLAPRSLGMVVSAYGCWQRMNQERLERETRPVSQHIGAVKSKVTVKGEVAMVRGIEGQYGVTTLLVLNCDGNVVKWFASGEHDFQKGATMTLTGTVKDHGEYKGVKETVLTRCKVG